MIGQGLIESESGCGFPLDAFSSREPASASLQKAMVASGADALYHTSGISVGW